MNILLAVDGSEWSDAAAREVACRPWPAGSTVRVLSVVDLSFSGLTAMGAESPLYFEMVDRTRREIARAAVDHAQTLVAERAPGVVLEAVIRTGPPALTIVEEAETWSADLVVVGSHGRGALGRFLLGSAASTVLSHAPCSVEIVRRRKGADQE